MPAHQLTIRNVEEELARRLKAMSAQRGESLNATVLALLRGAAGYDERRERLRRYATWTAADAVEFSTALADQRQLRQRDWS